MVINLADVAARVTDILAALDEKVTARYGSDELPTEGAELITVSFDAEGAIDVKAVEILEARGIARWVVHGEKFEVEANASLRKNVNVGQTKATLGLAARIDALEGALDKLVTQNERLLATLEKAPAKALPAAKKKAAKKKGGGRG
jgi:hypothetical protein